MNLVQLGLGVVVLCLLFRFYLIWQWVRNASASEMKTVPEHGPGHVAHMDVLENCQVMGQAKNQ